MKLSYKIILIFFVTLGIALSISSMKPKDLYYQALVKMHILKPCYSPNKDFLEVFKQEGFDYEAINKEVILTSLNKLENQSIPENDLKIPTITHHIYFIPEESSKPLLNFYIKKMEANFNKLNEIYPDWQHYLWSNNPKIFTEHIKQTKNVVVRNITELQNHSLYPDLINIIKNGNNNKAYFMEASDILRLMVLQKFGGIYNDMDYEIYNAPSLFGLMKRFDFIAGREFPKPYSYYGNSFMVAKANHPIINEALDRLKKHNIDQSNIPDYVKYPCNFYDKLYFNSPPLITIAYFSKNNIDGNNDVILPSWMALNVDFARFKNGECDYAKINKIGFDITNKNLNQLITQFSTEIQNTEESEDLTKRNIYYNYTNRVKFDIIGADMFCGTWVDKKVSRNYYWNFNKN